MRDFSDILHLQTGSAAQQEVYRFLHKNQLLEQLQILKPVLAGTFPLDIQVEGSDLDILCQGDPWESAPLLERLFGREKNFEFRYIQSSGGPALVAGFIRSPYPVEIFIQQIPVSQQMAYLHLLKEYELLQIYGEELRSKVITLKRQGIKTEPAFCLALGIEGDPYTQILRFPSAH